MEKEGLLSLFNNLKTITLLLFIILFVGCSKDAPELPQDYSSIDSEYRLSERDFSESMLQLSCNDIKDQLIELNKINEQNIEKISQTREYDQINAFIGAWFAVNKHTTTKAKIDAVYKQKDNLYKLQSYKKCN